MKLVQLMSISNVFDRKLNIISSILEWKLFKATAKLKKESQAIANLI